MEIKSACFTGHRELFPASPAAIKEKLRELLISLIEEGCTDFYNGGALGFDILSAEAVLEIKKLYPHIRLHIIKPCNRQIMGWSEENIIRYEQISAGADEVKCLSPVYYNGCMQVRNRWMVDNSDLCIAFLTKGTGGSAYTARYARDKGKEVINISELI